MMERNDLDFERLPGVYRIYDLPLLVEEGHVWRLEDAGHTRDGQPLFAVFVMDASDA